MILAFQNCRGRPGPVMRRLAARQPQPTVLALAELHVRPGEPLPHLEGYSRAFTAARPDGHGGVALLLADAWRVTAAQWRCDPAAGRLWVQVEGALPEGLPLSLGVAYLPPRGSPGCPADVPAWWLGLDEEWARAEAVGAVLCGMDCNGRTSNAPDWPEEDTSRVWQPRTSSDRAAVDSHGRQLLSLCQASSARICNGRVPGSTSGDPTSFGSQGSGRAVVDYWLASAGLLPLLPHMEVDSWRAAAQLSDHATLLLTLAVPWQPQQGASEQLPASQPQQQTARLPPEQRQFKQGTEEQMQAAVEYLGSAQAQLQALQTAVEVAQTVEQLEEVSMAFAEVMVAALQQAGMQQRSVRHTGSRQPQHGLPRHLQQQFGIRAARQARRRAEQAAAAARRSGSGQREQAALQQVVGRCRNSLRRRLTAAWRQCEEARGEQLEELAKADPAAFFLRYRSRGSRVLDCIPPHEVEEHFRQLLGEEPPAEQPPPEPPPPEPPPQPATAAATATATSATTTPASSLACPLTPLPRCPICSHFVSNHRHGLL